MRKFSLVLALAFVLAPFCSAQTAQPAAAKRPMTFGDMMQMKRLGEPLYQPTASGWPTPLRRSIWTKTRKQRNSGCRRLPRLREAAASR